MLKTALFDSAINEKCCSVDGGQGIRSLFSSHTEGFDSSRVPDPGNLPSKAKKMLMHQHECRRTTAWLAQLGERRSPERKVTDSIPGRTNTQGL